MQCNVSRGRKSKAGGNKIKSNSTSYQFLNRGISGSGAKQKNDAVDRKCSYRSRVGIERLLTN